MKILFLTSGRRVPSSRFRVLQFLPRFHADGFDVTVAPCVPDKYDPGIAKLPGKVLSRIAGILRSPFHDLVFLEREILPRTTPIFEEAVASMKRMHFDFDDAIHLRPGVPRVIELARTVSAGNDWLAAAARTYNDAVSTVPTAIDVERYTPGPRGDVPLVWTGTSSNLSFLESLAPALQRIPGARILVVCDRPPGDLGIPVEFIPWSEEVEVSAIRRGRVGLMPLPDDDWAKGKCGFKLLQYLACGIPAVASPVGVNPALLDGCGRLAGSEDEWVEAISRLLADPGDFAARGRRRAADFSISAVYPRLRAACDV